MSLQRLSHIGLCVSDLQRSLAFYREILGFRFLSEIEVAGDIPSKLLRIDGVELRAVYLERDGARLELLSYTAPGHCGDGSSRPMNQLGLTHLSFRVDDLAAFCEGLAQQGIQIIEASRIDIPPIAAAVFITDPDGTLIELVQSPGDPDLVPGQ